ncbi:hypothetical protein GCM10029963_65240 [Micromonospora andamanensis]
MLTGTDLAVATSGVYERGPHVRDPRRGAPARGLRSVTVIGHDLGLADAYATAAVAMGVAGIGWLDRLPAHRHAVITDDARCLHSADLPLVTDPAPDPAPPLIAPRRPLATMFDRWQRRWPTRRPGTASAATDRGCPSTGAVGGSGWSGKAGMGRNQGQRAGRWVMAGRDPVGRGRPGRAPGGRVAAHRCPGRCRRGGSAPPGWCLVSSVDIASPLPARARRRRVQRAPVLPGLAADATHLAPPGQ